MQVDPRALIERRLKVLDRLCLLTRRFRKILKLLCLLRIRPIPEQSHGFKVLRIPPEVLGDSWYVVLFRLLSTRLLLRT